ncbi:uncharacterized protein LOC129584397 isoform X2 [Paramacrobiotus metropolitanus]|uniref:uncharacterized protein LOC129584397 isoform X2 n=1 Tax=Paramacrobiotus metropolitanus TaxID=2943436 RepID=UPI00244581B6|nr:uncharacterized protein LOC129584397 isoform X2 [Paramacrobiotus metropolitanus]
MDKILNDAARHPVDGRIYLPIDNNKEKSNATADNLPIVLANSGDEAIFHCPLPLTPNITVMPDIAWAHNGQVVTVNSSNSIDVTARYDASPAVEIPASAATLILKNAKWSDRGVVECQQTCPDEPLRFCRLQAFRLRVTPTASELFPIPLPNVTVRRAAEARLQCVTSVTHPMEQFDSHIGFIWRFNRQWLEAPKRHPLRALIFINPESSQRSFRKYVPPDAVALDTVSEYGVEYSPTGRRATTLVLPRVQARSTARIECWVRPDYTREVWLMQTAYLHVV